MLEVIFVEGVKWSRSVLLGFSAIAICSVSASSLFNFWIKNQSRLLGAGEHARVIITLKIIKRKTKLRQK
jgi:hypothetical protein